eukprot:Skav213691  [mRNA]  locus=scaffold491:581753:585257:- [translate_table: standard]
MPEQDAVLEAFKKFDADGNGSICREELVAVLRALDPDDWDDNAVDHLLAKADANGDGALQIEEFLRWVFAEDVSKLGSNLGNSCLTILIDGSSRDDLNGEYVQQDEFYGHRPVFFNADKGKYLFYNLKHARWQIFVRTSWKASARLHTNRAPHLCGECWHVYTGGNFRKEEGMSTKLAPPATPEEKCVKAAAAIYMKTQWSNCSGGFLKTEKTFHDRPVYYNEEEKTWLAYEGKRERWIVGTNFCDKNGPTGKLVSSLKTEVYSPDLTEWHGTTTATKVDPARKAPHWEDGSGWSDDSFPHNEQSLGKKKDCEWVRAKDLTTPPALFSTVEPADACQGALGDCWLIAALAGVAEFPNFIRDHLFETKELAEDGKYRIKLFDWTKNSWTVVEIDDYIPCQPRKWYEPSAVTLFANVSNKQLYVVLMEKAFAKFAGSYQALSGGFSAMAWVCMTGVVDVKMFKRERHKPKWDVTGSRGLIVRKDCDLESDKLGRLSQGAVFEELEKFGYRVHFKKLEGEGPDEGWLSCYISGHEVARCRDPIEWKERKMLLPSHISFGSSRSSSTLERYDQDAMWSNLEKFDRANFLLAASIHNGNESEHRRQDGLVEGHAYSIIHAVECKGFKLVCCRNPWGNKKEWNGPWCDQSEEWTAHPDLADELQVDEKPDGLFWMDWESFAQTFSNIELCPKAMPAERANFAVDSNDSAEVRPSLAEVPAAPLDAEAIAAVGAMLAVVRAIPVESCSRQAEPGAKLERMQDVDYVMQVIEYESYYY